MSDQKYKYMKVERNGTYCIMALYDAKDDLGGAIECESVGDEVKYTIVEMTEKEYRALPEFDGW